MTAATSSESEQRPTNIAEAATGETTSPLSLPVLALGLAACTALPARVAIASEQGFGLGRLLYLAGGLAGDVAVVAPFFLLVLLVRPRRSVPLLVLAAVVLLLLANGAAEFRLERGIFPGPIDIREGTGHHDFLTAELPAVLAGRFLWMNLLSAGIATWMLVRAPRRMIRSRRALSFAVGAWALLFFASREGHAYCASIQNRDALDSPTGALAAGLLTRNIDGSPASTRALLVRYRGGSPEEIAEGARQMGMAPSLKRPLEEDAPSELIAAARALSALSGDVRKPIIFHVSLESMRADDIHSLVGAAPAELTPFLNDVYGGKNASVAAFEHAHQSGIRTSQALGAVMCGVGAMPFNLSISRDLGVLPLRCAPDVLADAGLDGHAFYGHDFAFDDMATFFRAHHLSLHGRESFDGPRGVWKAIADSAVYEEALTHAGAYNFVLTLSHHAPYTEPDDFAPKDKAAIEALCEARHLHGDNCARLRTLRYADQALARFIAKIESSNDAARTIVIVSGDHTVHQWVPWTSKLEPERELEPASGITRVPFFVHAPFLRGAAGNRFRELAKRTPISNADLPALLLALLDAPLRERLPDASQRWHSLGGSPSTSAHASALHGIDAHGVPFDVSLTTGEVRSKGITMVGLNHENDVLSPLPKNRPAVAFWADVLRR